MNEFKFGFVIPEVGARKIYSPGHQLRHTAKWYRKSLSLRFTRTLDSPLYQEHRLPAIQGTLTPRYTRSLDSPLYKESRLPTIRGTSTPCYTRSSNPRYTRCLDSPQYEESRLPAIRGASTPARNKFSNLLNHRITPRINFTGSCNFLT